MRFYHFLIGAALLPIAGAQTAIVQDLSHASQALGETRRYRAVLPPDYSQSQKRYPVAYWFHGEGERFDRLPDAIAAYVAGHDVIVVAADGSNPPGQPWNIGAVAANRQFPLYFPELVEQIDRTLRTIPDRAHRAVTGFSMGGFMAYWIAGKYPDLVGSASSLMGSPEFFVGPKGFDVEYNHEDFYGNYGGVRTLLVTGTRDPMRFYHRRLNAMWDYARENHETAEIDSDHAAAGIAQALDFHMRAFANPLPKPAVFSHADAYPNFTVWGWEAASTRRRPGFTVLENVSKTGFRSSVREWIPGGAAIPEVKLSIASAPLYPPGSAQTVSYVRLRDGKLRRAAQKADAQGRLSFELDGDAYEVGVSSGPLIALTGYDVVDGAWAGAGTRVNLKARFLNKGGTRGATSSIRWESPNPGVKIEAGADRLYGLAPGETGALPLAFTVDDPARAVVKLVAIQGENRMPLEIPLFPPAAPSKDFLISDGHTVNMLQHAVERVEATLGEGNRDGQAAPGESFAVLLPDGAGGIWMRAAELFTNDACVDNTLRLSDSWAGYDRVGASVKYSLPSIRAECAPGHVVRMLARILIPGTPEPTIAYRALEFPVWYRTK